MARPTTKEQARMNKRFNRIASDINLGTMLKNLDKDTGVYYGASDSIALVQGSMLIGDSDGESTALDVSTDANLILGDGTTAASVAMSGDATIANDGTLTIAAGAVDDAMLSSSLAKRPAIKAQGYIEYANGTDASADETVTIGSDVYTFKVAAGAAFEVTIAGTADGTAAALLTEIGNNGTEDVTVTLDDTNDRIIVVADVAGVAGNLTALETTWTNATSTNATLADGADAAVAQVVPIRHTITTNEATNAFLRLDTGLTSIESLQMTYYDAGVEAVVGATVSITGGVVGITDTAGGWANGDILDILAIGT